MIATKELYQLLYNDVLLPRRYAIDRDAEREAFDGITASLAALYRASQITNEEFCQLSDSDI